MEGGWVVISGGGKLGPVHSPGGNPKRSAPSVHLCVRQSEQDQKKGTMEGPEGIWRHSRRPLVCRGTLIASSMTMKGVHGGGCMLILIGISVAGFMTPPYLIFILSDPRSLGVGRDAKAGWTEC